MQSVPDFLYQSIIDQLSEPKVIVEAVSPEYRILLVNKAFEEFTGSGREQFLNSSFPGVFAVYHPVPQARQMLIDCLQKAANGNTAVGLPFSRYEIPLSEIPPPHWWKAEITPVADEKGKVSHLIFTVKVNVFLRMQLEKTVAQVHEMEAAFLLRQDELNEELRDARDKLSRSQANLDLSGKALSQSASDLKESNAALIQSQSNLAAVRQEAADGASRLTDMTESEYRLRRIVGTTPVGLTILKGGDMIIEMANDALLRIWGRSLSDVLDQPLMKVFPELEGQPFPALIRKVLDTGVRVSVPNEPALIILPDGTSKKMYVDFSYDALINTEGIPDAVLVSVHDITEVVEANILVQSQRDELEAMNEEMTATNDEMHAINEELTVSNEEIRNAYEEVYEIQTAMQALNDELTATYDRFSFALEAGRLGSYDLDLLTGKMTCSAQCKANYGMPPGAAFDFPDLLQSILPEYRDMVLEKVNTAIAGKGVYDADYQVHWPDGSIHWVNVTGKPVYNEEGTAIRMSGVSREITEQKADEQRKNDFIGMVSHELKTPLTSMNGYLQILQNEAREDKNALSSFMLERAVSQVSKMTAMINGFLNVSRLESGKIQIEKTRFDIAGLMKEAEEETLSLFKTHRFIFEPVGETFVLADRDKICHVINNFISNAVKYSPLGSLIQVACITINGNAQVSVKDHGIGVQPEDKKKLFDRYYRVKNATTQSVTGFGIGLYLCAEIIQRHNGNIWVESEAGQGSTFHFTLPVIE